MDTQKKPLWVPRHRGGFLAALLAGFLLASTTYADVLVLRNGQKINGTLSNRELVQSDPSLFQEITFLIDTPEDPILQVFNVDEIEYVQVQSGSETIVIDFRQATGIVSATTDSGDSSRTTWRGGIKAGINLSRLRGNDAGGFDEFRTGVLAGVFFTARKNQDFAIRVEALYSQKGGRGSNDPMEVELQVNYIEIPFLFVGTVAGNGNTQFNLFAGPSVAVLTSARSVTRGFGAIGVPDGDSDIAGETEAFDFGFMAGVDINLKMNKKVSAVIGASYTFGFRNWVDSTASTELKNSTIGLSLGLSFPFNSGDP